MTIRFLGVQPHSHEQLWRANCCARFSISFVDKGGLKWQEKTFKCLTKCPFLPFLPRKFDFVLPKTKAPPSSNQCIGNSKKLMPRQTHTSQATKPASVSEPPLESDKGFVTAPTLEQLRPTPREASLLETLWSWQEQSAKSRVVLGQPLKS
jgi:hypothetical protein